MGIKLFFRRQKMGKTEHCRLFQSDFFFVWEAWGGGGSALLPIIKNVLHTRKRLGNVLRRTSLDRSPLLLTRQKIRRWMKGGCMGGWRAPHHLLPDAWRPLGDRRTAALRANHASVREQPCKKRGGGDVSKTQPKTERVEGSERKDIGSVSRRAPYYSSGRWSLQITGYVDEGRDSSVLFVWATFVNDFLFLSQQHLGRVDYSIWDFKL